jgi:hypothetical protein
MTSDVNPGQAFGYFVTRKRKSVWPTNTMRVTIYRFRIPGFTSAMSSIVYS